MDLMDLMVHLQEDLILTILVLVGDGEVMVTGGDFGVDFGQDPCFLLFLIDQDIPHIPDIHEEVHILQDHHLEEAQEQVHHLEEQEEDKLFSIIKKIKYI